MIDIQIQSHANCIGRHQIIHIAILIQLDLCVAGAGRQGPHHHRGTALLASQQFGDGIDVIDRKPHNRTAWRHAGQFLGPRIDQFAHAFTAHELRLGDQMRNRAAHCVGAQKQRLDMAPRAQQTVGKDVPAFGICAKLNFIHHQAIDQHPFGHRFDGTDPILRPRRHNAFFARNQGHDRRPANGDDLVVYFPRKQTQW